MRFASVPPAAGAAAAGFGRGGLGAGAGTGSGRGADEMGEGDGAPGAALGVHCLGWQGRVRQHAVRQYGGRPSPGMRPRVAHIDGSELAAAITVVLVEKEPGESTALFRHIVRKTHDPERRYRDALKALSSAYYHSPADFSAVMTALFPADSALAATLFSPALSVP